MIFYVLAMGKKHLGPHVVVGYGIKIFWPGLFITSSDHLVDFYIVAFGVSWQDKNAHLGRDLNSSAPFSKIQTYIQSMPPNDL